MCKDFLTGWWGKSGFYVNYAVNLMGTIKLSEWCYGAWNGREGYAEGCVVGCVEGCVEGHAERCREG